MKQNQIDSYSTTVDIPCYSGIQILYITLCCIRTAFFSYTLHVIRVVSRTAMTCPSGMSPNMLLVSSKHCFLFYCCFFLHFLFYKFCTLYINKDL